MEFNPKDYWPEQVKQSKWRPIETLPSRELTEDDINGQLSIYLSDGNEYANAILYPPNRSLRWIDSINIPYEKQKFYPTHWAYPKGCLLNDKICRYDE